VLTFVSSQLSSLGYEVKAVSSGWDALKVLGDDDGFDLLFADVVLPRGMSGVELARRVREMGSEMKVLLTSGYPEEVFQQQGSPEVDILLLRKPYHRHDLVEAVQKALAEG
jgi:CheY-like chemotaxis protein